MNAKGVNILTRSRGLDFFGHIFLVTDQMLPTPTSIKQPFPNMHDMHVHARLSYVSICTCTCECVYLYHIKTGLNIGSVSIHMYTCTSSIWITSGSNSDG